MSIQRVNEIMERLDKTFKPRLNEEMETSHVSDDPTKEEMQEFLKQKYHTEDDFDVESAIYWFANDYHGGQNSNLYSALSTSEFRPGPMHKGIEDEESELASMMYQDLVNTYGGMNEMFGWSAREKGDKANREMAEAAKQEIQNYNFNRVFFQPAANADARGLKQSKEVRINGIKQELPTLAQLMPELFDPNQGTVSVIMRSNGKEYSGMIPLNWNFMKDSSGYINQEKAVQELNKKIDGLSQKTGLQEEQEEEFVPHGSYTVSNAGGYEIMLSPDGEQARVRDAFGSDNPETSDWLEIEWVSGKPVIDPYGYNIPLNQVMRR